MECIRERLVDENPEIQLDKSLKVKSQGLK